LNRNPEELKQAIAALMPLMTAADCCDRNAQEIGDREALVDCRLRLTWSQVKERSDRLAFGLLGLGLPRDGRVLVQLPNWVELFLTRLACEKAGLRLITVPPTFRAAELAPILRFTRPQAAILPKEFRGFRHVELIETVRNEELKHLLVTGGNIPPGALSFEELLSAGASEHESARLLESHYSVLDVCQVATTSGSTGTPKCVEVPLYTRLLTAWIHLQRFGVGRADKIAAVTPIVTGAADGLVYNGGCQIGAKIVLVDHFTPEKVCHVMAAEKVSVVPLVPTMMSRIMSMENIGDYDLEALRVVVNHGSSLPFAQGAEFERRLGCRIVQGYGSVDCGGICATSYEDPLEVRLGTVGCPLDGNEVQIIDEEGKEPPSGEAGRLLVRGLHTEARFYDNPDLNDGSRRGGYFVLHEVGRLDGAGNVVLMGREEDLIIRGGQNIFPTDIEGLLIQHPKIVEVSVIGLPDEEMGERLCACVVCAEGQTVEFEEVTLFMESKGVARFKWPERLEVMTALPKVASGHKIDKRKLKMDLVGK
jgi:2,3-dihydroxybenzoate-AMP ligase/acyl-CoA synthetase